MRFWGNGLEKHRSVWGFAGNYMDSFLFLIPVDDSKGFENLDTGWGSSDDRVNVGREDEIGIEINSN